MPVNRTKNFIFIHIPKVAGTSIEQTFGIYGKHSETSLDLAYGKKLIKNEQYSLQHIGYDQFVELGLIDSDEMDNYYTFSFIRNPWDRAVSDYKWQKNIRKRKLSFRKYLKEVETIVNQYSRNRLINCSNCHYVPQSWYIFDTNGITKVNFIGRYENLNKDIEQIQEALGIHKVKLSKSNQGKAIPYYFYYFDLRNIFLIRKIYKEDITRFNYHFFKSNAANIFLKKLLNKIHS
nr:sulfotransferase family 2 domain-containing protein [uncultured Carboxylicivirga sp.]